MDVRFLLSLQHFDLALRRLQELLAVLKARVDE